MKKYNCLLFITLVAIFVLIFSYLKLIWYNIQVINSIKYFKNSNILLRLNRLDKHFSSFSSNLSDPNDIIISKIVTKQKNYFSRNEIIEIKKHLKIYDLKQENTNQFDCVKSEHIIIQTIICLHDLKTDIFISQNIKTSGSWETEQLRLFMKILNSNENIQVFDVGAQLGQFTLFAAKLGRQVVSVEPFMDSYIRIHKAAMLESLTDKIILVTNGLSNKRGLIKKLKKNEKNIGGQGIEENSIIEPIQINKNKFYLRTIEMDDLITILPNNFNEAIMKIDIEDYEIKAFKKAAKLFDRVKFHAVFIEWMGKNRASRFNEIEINQFLDFMYSRGFICKNPFNLSELRRELWKFWPGDIVWIQKNSKF